MMALCEIDNPAYEIYIRKDGRWDYRVRVVASSHEELLAYFDKFREDDNGKHSKGNGESSSATESSPKGCEGV